MATFKLLRTKQCAQCPWKVSTNPYNIPDGYDPEKHKALAGTIAKPGSYTHNRAMACHHSNGEDGMYCIGWLHHQMGEGNNIALRLKMMNCENADQIKVIGKQHPKFEDTIPK